MLCINKFTTFPSIGLADHDLVYIELCMCLTRVRETTRKIMRYDNTNREYIRTDWNDTMTTIKHKYTSFKVNELWNIFKIRPNTIYRNKHTTQDDNIQT
jgi:hypothetical protein